MKKKLTKFLKLLLLTCFLTVFNSCEIEREYTETHNDKIHLRKMSFDEFKLTNTIFDKFKRASQINDPSQMERIIYDEQYGVYYDTDNIIFIEKDGYRSYTIPLIQQSNDSLVKNLVLYEKNNEPIKVKLMGYALTEEEINQIKNGEYVDVRNKTTSQSLVKSSSSTSIYWDDDSGCLVTAITTIIPGTMCYQNLHSYGEGCNLTGSQAATPTLTVVKYTYSLCSADNNGGGPIGTPDTGSPAGGDGSSTPTGNGSNTPQDSENNDEVITTPVIAGLEQPVKTPCQELEINSNDVDFKANMQTLKTNINGTVEKNFRILNGTLLTPPRSNPYFGPIQTGSAQSTATTSYVTALKALAHNHLKDSIHNHTGTFTPNDILQLNDIAILAENNGSLVTKEEFASYLVCDKGIYAIKITDINKLYNFALKYGTDNVFFNQINQFYLDNNISHGNEKQLQNIGFLKLLKDQDIGIEYYESDSNFENWKKLELNGDETNINEIPC